MAVSSGHQNQCRCVYTCPTERARDSPLLRSTCIQGSVRTRAQSWTARRHLHIYVHMSSTSAGEAERMWDEARQWEESLRAAGKLQARTIALHGQDADSHVEPPRNSDIRLKLRQLCRQRSYIPGAHLRVVTQSPHKIPYHPPTAVCIALFEANCVQTAHHRLADTKRNPLSIQADSWVSG
jgi:hypothetical protein